MTRTSWRFLFDVAAPALFICWIAWLSYGAVAGSTGYRALRTLKAEVAAQSAEVDRLADKRAKLELTARQLNPRSLDPDMVDEKIRSVLGYVGEDDLVVPRDQLEEILNAAQGS